MSWPPRATSGATTGAVTSLLTPAGGLEMTALRWIALPRWFALVGLPRADAVEIKEVTTPLGIKAWLVEDKSAPVVALSFSFAGGSAQRSRDPEGRDQPHGDPADRRRGPARCAGLQAAPGGCLRRR